MLACIGLSRVSWCRSAALHSITVAILAGLMWTCALAREGDIPVAGWVERATLYPDGLILNAKLDTGAKTTSINAVDAEFFTRDGIHQVRFALSDLNGRTVTLERPIVRTARIKRHFGRSQERPVIDLEICIGSVRRTVEVNLVDRTGLNYQLLAGRNFLRDAMLVDSGRTYLLSLDCPDT